jgi:hypothetical protein
MSALIVVGEGKGVKRGCFRSETVLGAAGHMCDAPAVIELPTVKPDAPARGWVSAWAACLALSIAGDCANAGVMSNDPKGFQGVLWGSSLAGSPAWVLRESTDRLQVFEPAETPPRFGDVPVDSIRLIMIDGQFARVTIRYLGGATHKQILTQLETQFGAIDRTPGRTMRGLDQQYNWRGTETEVNLTYGEYKQQGYLFIESRLLAPRFNEGILDGSF